MGLQQTITCDGCGKPVPPPALPAVISRGDVLYACSLRCIAKIHRAHATKADTDADALDKKAADDKAKADAAAAAAAKAKQTQAAVQAAKGVGPAPAKTPQTQGKV